MAPERIEVSRLIQASPAAIFSVLRDPRGHVAIDASGSLMSSDDEPVEKVGDQFVVHMDRDAINDFPLGLYDVTIEITRYEQDAAIEWTILGSFEPPIGHVYGYTLEATDEGTRVSSYCDWSALHERYRERITFPIIPESSLRATLGILARTVQSA